MLKHIPAVYWHTCRKTWSRIKKKTEWCVAMYLNGSFIYPECFVIPEKDSLDSRFIFQKIFFLLHWALNGLAEEQKGYSFWVRFRHSCSNNLQLLQKIEESGIHDRIPHLKIVTSQNWLRRRFQNGYQHNSLREKRLCCRIFNWETLTNRVKTMDFLCGTKPDRTNQLPSTFMELVDLWGTTDGGWRMKCLLKKKNNTTDCVTVNPRLRSLPCSWLYTYVSAKLEKYPMAWEHNVKASMITIYSLMQMTDLLKLVCNKHA